MAEEVVGGARRSSILFWIALLVGYVVMSCAWWHRILLHLGSRSLGGGLLDPGLFIWWLRWTPFAIGHGLYPLQTDYLQAPTGVSGMWNTSVSALGVLFWPVTATAGPVVSYNLALVLGPALSAWTAAMWLARHAGRVPAAVGGVVFGFSPFVVAHMAGGHLNFVFLAFVPLILLLSEDLLWRSPRPSWPRAPLLGAVVAVEMFISSEALLLTAMAVIGIAACLTIRYPRQALARCRALAPAAAIAVAVGVLLCGFPLWRQFSDQFRIDGPVQPVGFFVGVPGLFVHATPAFLAYSRAQLPPSNLYTVENGMFIGWPLLVALTLAVVLLLAVRGRRTATFVVVLAGLVAAVSQLAPGRPFGIPFRSPLTVLEQHIAAFQDVVTSRAALIMWAAIAWIIAAGVQALHAHLEALSSATWWRRTTLVLAPLTALAALIPLVPVPPTPQPLAVTPAFFTSSTLDVIPSGATVMVAPMATVGNNVAQLWQVQSGMRFKLVGGYALHSQGVDRLPTNYPPQPTLVKLFGLDPHLQRPYEVQLTPATLSAARAELSAAKTSFFVLGPSHYGYPVERARAVALFGREPDRTLMGVDLWRLG